MYIVKRKKINGFPFLELKGNNGEHYLESLDVVKEAIRIGTFTVDNAVLKGDRLYLNNDPQKPFTEKGYERSDDIMKMNFNEKKDLYYDVDPRFYIIIDPSRYTIDEMDCIVESSIWLEVEDLGSKRFDTLIKKDLYHFGCITICLKECIRRGMLTEDECREYLIGETPYGYNRDRFTFAEWIISKK